MRKIIRKFIAAVLILVLVTEQQAVMTAYAAKKKSNSSSSRYPTISTANTPDTMPITVTGPGAPIIAEAAKYIGNPYVYGGNDLYNGIDCSHYVTQILNNCGYNIEYRTSTEWINVGTLVTTTYNPSVMQAGDIVVFDRVGECGHVGIYDGQGYLYEAKGSQWGITHDRRVDECSKPLLGIVRVTEGGVTTTGMAAGGYGLTGEMIIQEAARHLGSPYVLGGDDYETGIDCSHYVQRVLNKCGYDIEWHKSYDWINVGTLVTTKYDESVMQAGDIVIWGWPEQDTGHVAFYDGKGYIYEAADGHGVINTRKLSPDYGMPLIGVVRVAQTGIGGSGKGLIQTIIDLILKLPEWLKNFILNPLVVYLLKVFFGIDLSFIASSIPQGGNGLITVDTFLASCKNTMDRARQREDVWGGSVSSPPCEDGVISCDRLVSRALWDLGLTDQPDGGRYMDGDQPEWLVQHGFIRSYSFSDIKKGSIVYVKHSIHQSSYAHVRVCASDMKGSPGNYYCDCYDAGTDERIKTAQPLKNERFSYPDSDVMVFNIPATGIAVNGSSNGGSSGGGSSQGGSGDQSYTNKVSLGTWRLTAYADTPHDQGKYVGQTASGAPLVDGRTVAVSSATMARRGLHFGDRLMINGHVYVIEDHGGSAMENEDWVDIFVADPDREYDEWCNGYAEVFLVT